MAPPSIETSTKEERQAYIREKWECMHNCELCGKCHILKGRDAETLYADYIEGKRSYLEITLDILKSASNLNGNLNGSKELEHYAS